MSTRGFFRVELAYGLFHAERGRAPGEQRKTWFFEVPLRAPSTVPSDLYWNELLHRMFYDANVRLRRAEPNDANWLGLVGFTATVVDPASILAWTGQGAELFPWVASERNVVWEPGPCYFVASDGRYDTFGYIEYTELMMNRSLAAGLVDEAGFQRFMRLFFPGSTETATAAFRDRAERLRNIEAIREVAGVFRRQPGSQPVCSGPPTP